MKKAILAIGVIVLFIGMAIIPGTTAIKDSQVESLNDTRYKFSGKAFYCVIIFEEWDVSILPILGLATIEGECSEYRKVILNFGCIFDIENEGDYVTVDPWIGKTRTYTYQDIGTGYMGGAVGIYFVPGTVTINEI